MSRRSRRGLSPEDRDIWQRVTRTATPLKNRPARVKPLSKALEVPAKPAEPPQGLPRFEIGSKAATALPARPVPAPSVRMDRKLYERMRRGKAAPEGRIDLHGMTAAAAHVALTEFILSSQAAGRRLVLVITGKGRSGDDVSPGGVLRAEVPHWLRLPPLAAAVLQIAEAHRRHGGSGALYVYLSRRR